MKLASVIYRKKGTRRPRFKQLPFPPQVVIEVKLPSEQPAPQQQHKAKN